MANEFCIHCGQQHQQGALFCPNTGRSLSPTAQGTAPVLPPPSLSNSPAHRPPPAPAVPTYAVGAPAAAPPATQPGGVVPIARYAGNDPTGGFAPTVAGMPVVTAAPQPTSTATPAAFTTPAAAAQAAPAGHPAPASQPFPVGAAAAAAVPASQVAAAAEPAAEHAPPAPAAQGGSETTAFDMQSVIAVLRQAFEIYKQNWKPFLITAAVLYVPVLLLNSLIVSALMPAAPVLINPNAADLAEVVRAVSSTTMWLMTTLSSFLTALLITGIATPLIHGALTVAVADRTYGGTAGPGHCWRVVLARAPRVLSAIIPAAVVTAVGMLLFVIPGLVAAFLLVFTAQVALIEGLGGVAAMKRSYQLVLSDWLRVLVLLIVFGFVTWLAHAVAGAVTPRGSYFWSSLIGGLLTMAVLPFTAVGAVLIYFERRKATDGLDEQSLRREIEAAVR